MRTPHAATVRTVPGQRVRHSVGLAVGLAAALLGLSLAIVTLPAVNRLEATLSLGAMGLVVASRILFDALMAVAERGR